MENTLHGKLYIAGIAGSVSPTPFTTAATIATGEMTILESAAKTGGEMVELMGDLTITPKAKESNQDNDYNMEVNSEEITIEGSLKIDSKLYESFLTKFQGKSCEIRVIDEDSDRMGQVTLCKPYFAPELKTAKAVICTMTASYTQAANLTQEKKRYRLVKLTQA